MDDPYQPLRSPPATANAARIAQPHPPSHNSTRGGLWAAKAGNTGVNCLMGAARPSMAGSRGRIAPDGVGGIWQPASPRREHLQCHLYISAPPLPLPCTTQTHFCPQDGRNGRFSGVWGVRGSRRPAEWPRRRSMAQTNTSGHPTPCWPSPVPYIRRQPHPSSPHSTQKRGFGAENGCFGYSVGYDGAWGGRRQVEWSRRHRAGQVTSGDHPTPAAHQRSQVYASKPH